MRSRKDAKNDRCAVKSHTFSAAALSAAGMSTEPVCRVSNFSACLSAYTTTTAIRSPACNSGFTMCGLAMTPSS